MNKKFLIAVIVIIALLLLFMMPVDGGNLFGKLAESGVAYRK